MKVLWQKDETYFKFLTANQWAFKFLPNWTSNIKSNIKDQKLKNKKQKPESKSWLDQCEKLLKTYQLKHMGSIKGQERVYPTALYLHPEDKRTNVLSRYKQQLAVISKS